MPVVLSKLASYETGIFDDNASEIVAFDQKTNRFFVTNSSQQRIDVLELDTSAAPTLKLVTTFELEGPPNSVAANNGLVVVAVDGDGQIGNAVFFDADAASGAAPLATVPTGVTPDMVTFTPDGTRALVAVEGEMDDPAFDPKGSVAIIDVSQGFDQPLDVAFATFDKFDGQEEALRADGIRIFPDRSASQDLEPEFLTVSPDSQTAYVTLEENNAIAVVNIDDADVIALLPLGSKDNSVPGQGLDASDRDDAINIANWPVSSFFMPDGIALLEVNGENYLVTANEGDNRDDDSERVENLTLDEASFPDADSLQERDAIGRLRVSTIDGNGEDGEFEALYALGARSFAIWTVDGTRVFESGDQFEQSTAALLPDFFNADKDQNKFDAQSRNQGPQPEGIAVGEVDGAKLAITGLEDIGGLQVYEVTEPGHSAFLGYFTTRDFSNGPDGPAAGDLSPEGVTFIAAGDSPTGRPLVAAGFETSGSTVLFEFKTSTPFGTDDVDLMAGDDSQDVLIGLAGNDFLFGHGGDDKLFGGLDDDRMRGGEGDDLMLGQAGNDLLLGDRGDDVLLGNEGDDILKGGDGEDTARGGFGDDELYGGAGDDELYGGVGDDLAFGSQGDDRVEGGLGDDILIGGSGDDILAGGFGLDVAIFEGLFAEFRISGRNALVQEVQDLTGDEGDDTLSLVELLQFEDGFLDARDNSFTEGYASERVEALMTDDGFTTDPESPFATEVASITRGETLVIEGDVIA